MMQLMKQKLFYTLLFITSIHAFSQETKFTIEANYPFTIGENFIGKNYDGIADAGFKYSFTDAKLVNLGLSVNGSLLNYNFKVHDDFAEPFDYKVNAYFIQPRIFAELVVASIDMFHPSVSLGYSFILFNVVGPDPLDFSNETAKDSQSGINLNVAVAYDLTEKIFIQLQYDFIKLGTANDIPNTAYNTNVDLVKIGLGYRI